jgi:hypothetical protein
LSRLDYRKVKTDSINKKDPLNVIDGNFVEYFINLNEKLHFDIIGALFGKDSLDFTKEVVLMLELLKDKH